MWKIDHAENDRTREREEKKALLAYHWRTTHRAGRGSQEPSHTALESHADTPSAFRRLYQEPLARDRAFRTLLWQDPPTALHPLYGARI